MDVPSGDVVEVPLAQTGEGIAECELLNWFVQEGDTVEEFQKICDVQSDKATIEITSRYSGKIHQILFVPGDIIKVGETLVKIIVEENEASALHEREFVTNGDTQECQDSSSDEDENKERRVLCTPSVRRIAKQHDVNISDICGSGTEGRVMKEDILNYLENKDTAMPKVKSSHMDIEDKDNRSYEDRIVRLRGYYRSMVKSMSMAVKVPHFHYVEEINCNALAQLKTSFQEGNQYPDIKYTYLPFLIKSLSTAMDKYPLLNSSFREEANEVILKGSHNIGIAMATPNGLVVPNIKKVQSLSILEITKELSRLQQMALDNKLNTEDISGGTITLSNIGAVGGKFGCPLLNLPEVAIIAIGRIEKLPRFANDGTVYAASIANVAIGADHRVVDGATVARFCREWKLLIEKPELLFLHMR